MAEVRGLPLSPDALLESVGVFRDETGEMVREVPVRIERFVEDGKEFIRQRIQRRRVAPPGMPIIEARRLNLDFYSPALGWIRGGMKREAEHLDNLGAVDPNIVYDVIPAEPDQPQLAAKDK